MTIITFTSDFGLRDTYAAVVHGVIEGIAPGTQVIDLTHSIPPQAIRAGALALFSSYPPFPAGTIHLAVVDPGVGSPRRAVLLAAHQQWFIGPDNGLFTLVMQGEPAPRCWELDQPAYWRQPLSATFHGRDLFGPVAAHLASGVDPDALGTRAPLPLVLPDMQLNDVAEGTTHGLTLAADHFGNLLTNLRATATWTAAVQAGTARAWVADQPMLVVRTYADAPAGTLVVLAGSAGLLEVAQVQGSAAGALGSERSLPVQILIP